MASSLTIALYVKSTFLHAKVVGEVDDVEDLDTLSVPVTVRPRACSAPARVSSGRTPGHHRAEFVHHGRSAGWRRVPAEAVEADTGVTRAARAGGCRPQRPKAFSSDASTGATWEDVERPPSSSRSSSSAAPAAEPAAAEPAARLQGNGAALGGDGSEDDGRTTVMMRNIPTAYTREQLVELLNSEGFFGGFDFMYLPIKFETSANAGFAFVNLTTPAVARRFHQHFAGFRAWGAHVRTGRVCNMSWARGDQQGLAANIQRYRNSSVMHPSVDEEHRPLVLSRGAPVRFPRRTKRLWPPSASFGAHANRAAHE